MPLLHDELDRITALQPDVVAFRFKEEDLSYQALSTRSEQLAAHLQQCGVAPGDRVAILQHKSLSMPVAVYGILKAGAAYIPLDPRIPSERLLTILNSADISVLISDEPSRALIDRHPLGHSGIRELVGIEEHQGLSSTAWDTIYSTTKRSTPVAIHEDSLAYIMYTSGSTGTPKGMMHTHRSGHAYARLSGHLYQIGPGDRMGNHSALHFDMSLFEFFTGPLHGATSILIPEDTMMFPSSLADLIEEERLTVWYSVPAALTNLLLRGDLDNHDLSALRLIAFAGEPFPPRYLKQLMATCPSAQYSNVYGPAEVNQCTHYTFNADHSVPDHAIPIGQAWDDTKALIMNEQDHPASRGELLIASPTMMTGYWARDDLNATVFYYGDDGTRYYRTGDLVEENSDGQLMFLGRKDRQIKARGYRIELDEIESVLMAQNEIVEAAVVAIPAMDESNTLVAVISGPHVQLQDLRRKLAETLPWYALPHNYYVTDALPRSATGKIDRLRIQENFRSIDQ